MRMSVHLTSDQNPGRTQLVIDPANGRIWSAPEELEQVLRVLESFPSRDGDAAGYFLEADFEKKAFLLYHTSPGKGTSVAFLELTFGEVLRMSLRELGRVIGRAYKEELDFVK